MATNPDNAGGLLPCPFCGGRAEAGPCDDRFTRWFLGCQSCGASTDTCKAADRFEAVRNLASSWNRRAELCRAAPAGGDELADPAKSALMAASDKSMGIGFDKWFENPYTQVVLKSIAEDYVPRDSAPAGGDLACQECSAPGLLFECVACSHSNYPKDSAPAGSGEVSELVDRLETEARLLVGCIGRTDQSSDVRALRDAAALLRKLQQGADTASVPDGMVMVQIEDAKRLAQRVLMSDPVYVQLSGRRIRACIAASQGQEGGK